MQIKRYGLFALLTVTSLSTGVIANYRYSYGGAQRYYCAIGDSAIDPEMARFFLMQYFAAKAHFERHPAVSLDEIAKWDPRSFVKQDVMWASMDQSWDFALGTWPDARTFGLGVDEKCHYSIYVTSPGEPAGYSP